MPQESEPCPASLELKLACRLCWRMVFDFSTEGPHKTTIPTSSKIKHYEWFDWEQFRRALIEQFVQSTDPECHARCYRLTDVTAPLQPDLIEAQQFLANVVRRKENYSNVKVIEDELMWGVDVQDGGAPKKLYQRYFIGPGMAFPCGGFSSNLGLPVDIELRAFLKPFQMISGLKRTIITHDFYEPFDCIKNKDGYACRIFDRKKSKSGWLTPIYTYTINHAMTGIKVISTGSDDAQLSQRGVHHIWFTSQGEDKYISGTVSLIPQTNISERTKICAIEYQELEAGQSEKHSVALNDPSNRIAMYLVFDTRQVDTII